MSNIFWKRVTIVIMGWTAGRTCINHNSRYTKTSKFLCLTQPSEPRVGDPYCTNTIICDLNIWNFLVFLISYVRRLYLQKWSQTKKGKNFNFSGLLYRGGWEITLRYASHLSPTLFIAFDRLFRNINIMISYSINQTALTILQVQYFAELLRSEQQVNLPQSEARTLLWF